MNISYNWLKDLIKIDLPVEELARKLTGVGLAVEGIHQYKDDFVLDIDLTSNRPDCLSHLGVAREIGVITEKILTAETQRRGEDEVTDAPFPAILAPDIVRIEDADLCRRFTARIIRNVKIAPSPEWLVQRLEAIGERAINNVADITNYVMHELGQPMHAFDLDKLTEKRIVVRRAKRGEMIKTLDEIERKLDASMLAICDAERPVAVAGVMGGFDSGISDGTSNVLLEVAYFKREGIRATSRKLGLASEASYRFERGVDIENVKRASDRATELICELASGEAGEFVDIYPTRFVANEVGSRDISAAVKRLTGLDVRTEECVRILTALGIAKKESEISDLKSETGASRSKFEISNLKSENAAAGQRPKSEISDLKFEIDEQGLGREIPDSKSESKERQPGSEISDLKSQIFVSPSWRYDIAIEEDLVEEVARHAGYDQVAEELPPAFGAGEYQATEIRKKLIRRTLADNGFDEAIGYSFIDTKHDDVFADLPELVSEDENRVTLRDSVIEGAVRMRPTLLPGLLESIRLNFNHQRRDLKLFEIGKVFAANGEGQLPKEREVFAVAVTGGEVHENRAMPSRDLDFYDAKGAVEAALEAAGSLSAKFEASEAKHLRSGQSASVVVGEKTVGFLGRLNEEIAANYKFKQPVYVAEIDLQAVMELPSGPLRYAPLPKYPSIVRDVSLLVNRRMSFEQVRQAVLSNRPEFFQSVDFVDIYEGKGLADDERSLTIRLEYRSGERTLTDEETTAAHDNLIRKIESDLGIRQRL